MKIAVIICISNEVIELYNREPLGEPYTYKDGESIELEISLPFRPIVGDEIYLHEFTRIENFNREMKDGQLLISYLEDQCPVQVTGCSFRRDEFSNSYMEVYTTFCL